MQHTNIYTILYHYLPSLYHPKHMRMNMPRTILELTHHKVDSMIVANKVLIGVSLTQ